MKAPFDNLAPDYDHNFTNSLIGKFQRAQVWNYLDRITPQLIGREILELNCGTGADAVSFAQRGFNVLATDVSEKMLEITKSKIAQQNLNTRIQTLNLNLEHFDRYSLNKRFDLVFSNFGGINCISPESLETLLKIIPSILLPGGRFIAVIMPRFCLWEIFYFLIKGQPSKAIRRWTSREVIINLNGWDMKIWYHQPSLVKRQNREKLKTISTLPIGIALPPSYLEGFFAKRQRLLNFLNALERAFNHFPFLASLADHYIIDLELK